MRKLFYKYIAALTITSSLLSIIPLNASADENTDRRKEHFDSNSQVRKWHSKMNASFVNNREALLQTDIPVKSLASKFGIQILKNTNILENKNIYLVRIPEKLNYNFTLEKLNQISSRTYAEPNYMKNPMFTLNDEYFTEQWYWPRLGILDSWNMVSVKKDVVIALLDTGVNPHPDLEGQILPGFDMLNQDDDPSDDVGHGTKIAGILAANANNEIGIAGINPAAKILPIKIGDEDYSPLEAFVAGIYYAIEQEVDIISISFGSEEPSQLEYDAIMEAVSRGILVVASSGNEQSYVSYPAAYPEVLSVGSTDPYDFLSDFSNFGIAQDLVAPGEEIPVTTMDGDYDYASGTSFSAPIVSGLASLILAESPNLYPEEVEYLLEQSAYKIPHYKGFWNMYTGYGRANVYQALQTRLPSLASDAGNDRAKAKTVSVNKSLQDKYDMPLDFDWFVYRAPKKMKVKVEINGVAGMDPVLWTDRYDNGVITEEKVFDSTRLGGSESAITWLKPGNNYFQLYDKNNHYSHSPYKFQITELDTTPPSAPTVNKLFDTDKKITGKAEKDSTILLKAGTKIIAKGTVASNATFSLVIKPQKANTTLHITSTDKAGNVSKATKIIVQKPKQK